MTGTSLVLRLFGPLGVERDGVALVPPASRKTRAILGFLALAPRPVGRQRLCDLFFDIPDDPRAALRWSLTKLRPLVDAADRPRLLGARDAIGLDLSGVAVDALRVQAIAAAGDTVDAQACEEALGLMAGEFLEDCELPDCPDYAAWLAAQRQDFRAIAQRLARRLAELSEGGERIRHLHRLLALDPLDEASAAMLVRALAAAGRRDEAHALVAATERQLRAAGLTAGPSLRMALRAPGLATETVTVVAPAALEGGEGGRLSVAVIPFLNHSPDLFPEELTDGMLEALVHMLSRFRDLKVAGWSRSIGYKGSFRDPAAMGVELGATHLVGGSLMARDGLLKLRYRIVEAADGALLTSGDVDHAGTDAFALLEDAPAQLAVLVAQRLIEAARARALGLPVAARTAWDHYHAGVVEGLAAAPADYALALEHFNRAIEADPRFAKALGTAAWARACLGHGQVEESRQAALLQAHQAIALGGDDAEALAVGAWAAVHVAQDFDAALRAAEQAVRANPLSRVAWSTSGWVRAMAGEVETPLLHFDRAERCNPWGAHLDNVDGGRAFCLWQGGRHAEAAAFAARSIERLPGHVGGHCMAIASAAAMADSAAVAVHARRFLALFPAGAETGAVHSIPLRDRARKAALLETLRAACAGVA